MGNQSVQVFDFVSKARRRSAKYVCVCNQRLANNENTSICDERKMLRTSYATPYEI